MKGLPEGPKAVAGADGGEAGKEGIGEDQLAIGIDAHVVDVAVAGGVTELGDIEAVVAVGLFTGTEHVLEAPDLVKAAQPEAVAIAAGAEAHAAVEGALEHRQFAVGLEAQGEQLADLIGGESQGDVLLRQPGEQLAGGGDLEAGGSRHAHGGVGLASQVWQSCCT
jgi:hypothetical protein